MCGWWEVTIGLNNGLVPNERQAIILSSGDPDQWRIYATLGRDGLKWQRTFLDALHDAITGMHWEN